MRRNKVGYQEYLCCIGGLRRRNRPALRVETTYVPIHGYFKRVCIQIWHHQTSHGGQFEVMATMINICQGGGKRVQTACPCTMIAIAIANKKPQCLACDFSPSFLRLFLCLPSFSFSSVGAPGTSGTVTHIHDAPAFQTVLYRRGREPLGSTMKT